jgi:hypothetical protein
MNAVTPPKNKYNYSMMQGFSSEIFGCQAGQKFLQFLWKCSFIIVVITAHHWAMS